MTKNSTRKRPPAIWRVLSSLRLTITVLILMAVASVVGTVIPQRDGAVEFARDLSPAMLRLFETLSLFDMYHSIWFRFLIGVLTLNLIVCSVDRFPATLTRVRGRSKPDRNQPFENLPPHRTFGIPEPADRAAHAVADALHRRYRHSRHARGPEGHFFLAETGRYSHFGVYLVHLSVLLILTGAMVGSFFGFEAYVTIPEGAQIDTVDLKNGHVSLKLPFQVRCDDFFVDFHENGSPKEYRSKLTFLHEGTYVTEANVLVNHPVSFRGVTFYQSSYGTIAGNTVRMRIQRHAPPAHEEPPLDLEKGVPFTLPGGEGSVLVVQVRTNFMRMGPAVQVSVRPAGGGRDVTFWVFQKHEMVEKRFPGIAARFPALNASAFEPYTFVLDSVQSRHYTGLQVNRDPGVSIVWAGCFLMVAGFFVTFFTSHRRIRVRVSTTTDGTAIGVAGSASKNPVGLHRELDQLVDRLKGAFDRAGTAGGQRS